MTAMTDKLPLSGVVIAKDEGDRIGRCVVCLAALCREVIVLDSGSGDYTLPPHTAARVAGRTATRGFGFAAHNIAAIARATQPWVLLLDAKNGWNRLRLTFQALFPPGPVNVPTPGVCRAPRFPSEASWPPGVRPGIRLTPVSARK